MKVEMLCGKCNKIVIGEKDFIGCFICPKCGSIIGKTKDD